FFRCLFQVGALGIAEIGGVITVRALTGYLHDEWRLPEFLNLLELGNHLPVLRSGSQRKVDVAGCALRISKADGPEIVLFIKVALKILELEFFGNFLEFSLQLLDLFGRNLLVALKI